MRSVLALFALLPGDPVSREIANGWSVEWKVYDADWIGMGTIDDVRITGRDGFPVWVEATLKITETLKGEKRDTLTFALRHVGSGESPSTWKKDACEILLFLVEGRRCESEDREYGKHAWTFLRLEDSAFRLDRAPACPMFDASFAAHETKKDILSATRAALGAMQAAKPGSLRILVPADSPAFKALYGGSAVYLDVPVDKPMETRARGWLAAMDTELRVTAVKILGKFKSEENVTAVRKCLSDPGYWIEEAGTKRARKVYAIRREAFRVLKAWGIEFAEPVLEEPFRDR
jgi:hypothetical protein